jgi:hypothetical protein
MTYRNVGECWRKTRTRAWPLLTANDVCRENHTQKMNFKLFACCRADEGLFIVVNVASQGGWRISKSNLADKQIK